MFQKIIDKKVSQPRGTTQPVRNYAKSLVTLFFRDVTLHQGTDYSPHDGFPSGIES
ncbi:MAG: hypothetical protein O3A29_19695 [Planctomycetota bacterium]|nr:hypothetical protein [Planctomycetota bacterium]